MSSDTDKTVERELDRKAINKKGNETMTTRIKVTLDTDQWGAILALFEYADIDEDHWLGKQRTGEMLRLVEQAAQGTGEGEPCQCEGVDGE